MCDEIKQEIRGILHDMRHMDDNAMYSIALVREMLEGLLDEGDETHPDGLECSPEIIELVQDGTLCELCGSYIGVAIGEPRTCEGCGGDQE